SLWERLRVLGIEWRHLGFAANPRNVLLPFPSRSGKLILRGALVERGFAWDRIEALCAWLAEGAVLLNSVKCRALARRIASEAAHRGLPVYAVLTRSLEAAFALDAVAAYARAVFCGSPDSSFLTGIAATGSIDRAADGAEVLGSCTGRGPAFLSLGADGVIVADTDTMDLVHVRCRKGLRRPIQQVVDVNPSCVNGCGDVFAQAATVRLMGVGPWSGAAGGPLAVRAAVDGCLAAVRHLGFEGRLSAGDFDCVRLRPWRLGNLGASGVA
ncbi:MAG: hypothetical protein NTW28_00900, partial [Candidatus Solibacter sp.]|nr:hypothetical protein [Candidatus Solibacter sp.]